MNAADLPMSRFVLRSTDPEGRTTDCPFQAEALAQEAKRFLEATVPDVRVAVIDLGAALPGLENA